MGFAAAGFVIVNYSTEVAKRGGGGGWRVEHNIEFHPKM